MPIWGGRLRLIVALFAAVLASLAGAAGASAAPGDLVFEDCVADNGRSGCADPGVAPLLSSADDLVVSPDGEHVYVITYAIVHFTRAEDGSLAFHDCLADGTGTPCTDNNAAQDQLSGLAELAISPNGNDIYATSDTNDMVVHATLGGDDNLAFGGCFANLGAHGCTDPALDSIVAPRGVAVSPNGLTVQVVIGEGFTAGNDSGITAFARATNGSLTYGGCYTQEGQYGCADAPLTDDFVGMQPIVIGPESTDAYVGAGDLRHYGLNGTAAPTFISCMEGPAGCSETDGPLASPNDLALDADGGNLYAVSNFSESVTHVSLPGGALDYESCVGQATICTDAAPPSSISNPSDVAVTSDGASIYVSSPSVNAIAHLTHDQNDDLVSTSCIAEEGEEGCADPPTDSLDGVTAVAVSSDDEDVYAVTGFTGSDTAITHFSRAGGSDTACEDAQAKLEKAKEKLKKLKQQGASKSKIKKAKKKVKAAQEAVDAACR